MKALKYLPLFVVLLAVVSVTPVASSLQTSNLSLSAFGTISYPTPPINPENLGGDLQNWFRGVGTPTIDYTVVHTQGNPSLKVPSGAVDYSPNLFELNNYWIPVSIGDRVIFRAWIKADQPSQNFAPCGYIGFDLYGSTQRLWEVSDHLSGDDQNNLNTPKDWNYKYVPFGSDWMQLEVDFIIPDTPFYVDDYGTARSPSPQYVAGIIPWMSVNWRLLNGVRAPELYECPADVWFADMELYIISAGAS